MSSTPNPSSIASSAVAPAGTVAGAPVSRLALRPQGVPAAHLPGVSPGTARGHRTAHQQAPIPIEETVNFEETGGWDAYDVWRRFIKEAREKRRHPG